MKKILVTGGAGYIGAHTIIRLAGSGYEPVILDNFSNTDERVLKGLREILGREVTVYRVNCTDREALDDVFRRERPDGVIHFAAYKAVAESVAEPLRYYHNNLLSLIHLLACMEVHGCHDLVFSSSCTVYGQPKQNPVTEQTPRLPANAPYGRTKQMGEDIITDFCAAHPDFRCALLRYFNPVGAHESGLIGELPYGVPGNLVPFLTQVAAGVRSELVVFGNDYGTSDGSCIRDYIHVMDLAEAHVAALGYIRSGNPGCAIFNLGQGLGHSVLDVIKTFTDVTGVKVSYRIGDRRPGDVEQIWADVALASQELRWKTTRTLSDALRDAWNWQVRLISESHSG